MLQISVRRKRTVGFFRVSDNIRELKHDIYGRLQTANITFEFLFFSSNP